jgi:short-subunit dehydrogenase
MTLSSRPLALVTGASSGIGFELARCCAEHGFDLLIAADEPAIQRAAKVLRQPGISIEAVQADLATPEGVDAVCAAAGARPIAALLANAGRGLGHAFLDQDFEQIQRVVDTNVTGTLYLVHKVGREMRRLGRGRILIVGSIAGYMPGTYNAVYNGTKALIDSFSYALRQELDGTGVTVTCLMPGATETRFFERANLLDTRLGAARKARPDEVAKLGFDAMMRGEGEVVAGLGNKLRALAAHVMPAELLARQHARVAKPGSAQD